MEHKRAMERRQFLRGAAGAASLMALAGCDSLTQSSWFPGILNKAEKLTGLIQRAVTPAGALAKEYSETDISPVFPANGNTGRRSKMPIRRSAKSSRASAMLPEALRFPGDRALIQRTAFNSGRASKKLSPPHKQEIWTPQRASCRKRSVSSRRTPKWSRSSSGSGMVRSS